MISFSEHLLQGLKANQEKMESNVHDSLMLVTCLNPVIGYKKAAQAAQYAYQKDLTLKEAIVQLGFFSAEQFDEFVVPEKMIQE